MTQYFEAYAASFDLHPRFGETVRQVRRDDGHWLVEATSTCLRSHHIVIATGNNAEPIVPDIAGLGTFRGKVLHSADYANAVPFAGQSVLVIGMGNTGAEIALDLAEAGAHPTISVRSGVHIVPRELFGVPIQLVGMLATKVLPQRANDRLFPIVLDLALGNLEKHGIRRPKQGLLEQIATASRIPVIDVGTVRAISSGAIKVAPDVRRIMQTGALFNDGTEVELDTVILATGYRPSYPKFLQADVQPVRGGVNERASALRLYLIGFHNPVTGLLREISREAMRVADDIMAVERKSHR
ncbi:NAD(P)/FAD-dependent oxidoreductase [Mesorhizobium sp. STM 4661]|uniref:flavin-containing monooxygenase n=1 Tax=Mesorhizobium sp. STM 4661 TaxID=1297570 RepID=UPI00329792DB